MRYVVGIDIGGTNFRIGAVNAETDAKSAGQPACLHAGAAEHFRKIRVGEVFHTRDALADLTAYLKAYCALLAKENKEVCAVSIGFPATLDRERQTVLQAPNVPFMENLPVAERLTKELEIPVVLERDVTMALYYDMRKYALEACESVIGIYFGTGIGNAIFLNGNMLAGRDGTAGELGHIPVDGSTERCGCGNEGCLENLAGGKYLARLCRETYPGTDVADLFARHKDDEALTRFVDRMAIAAATEINILNPDCVLLGGGVPQMKAFPREELERRIRLRTRKPYPERSLNLIFTGDEEDKSVLGAAVYAGKKLTTIGNQAQRFKTGRLRQTDMERETINS